MLLQPTRLPAADASKSSEKEKRRSAAAPEGEFLFYIRVHVDGDVPICVQCNCILSSSLVG